MTKASRIKMVKQNLLENQRNYDERRISRSQYRERKRDGEACITEIKSRKEGYDCR